MRVVQKMYGDVADESLNDLRQQVGNGNIELKKMRIYTKKP